jgi:two-component system, OmpR family, phosphate regulon sensor histidine kinase PhoR
LGTAAALAAVPLATLAVLVLAGELRSVPAFVAGLAVLAGAVAAALLWTRDLRLILAALHLMDRTGADGEPVAARRPWLPAAARVGREARLLSRVLAARAAEAERLLRTETEIAEKLPDPLLVLGVDRIGQVWGVRRANAAARTRFGTDMAAVLRHPELRAAVDQALRGGAWAHSVSLSLSAPIRRDVEAVVIPLDPPLAGGGRVLAVLSDRTRERAVEHMRADFVANASHELRTPLASLIGFIETLRGPARDDPAAQERFLSIMGEQAARMSRLVADLLRLSRIEVAEHRAPDEDVALAPLLRRVAALFEPLVAERRMRLLVEAPGALPPVAGDEDQLEQVVQNLLDNAVKYGREGGTVRLAAEAVPPGSNPGGRWPPRPGIVIAVQDDGMGIPPEHLPRLTERFYRVDKGRSRAVGGTGLGLAIVKHVVNRHRGQLAIESAEGTGSIFQVWLPRREG